MEDRIRVAIVLGNQMEGWLADTALLARVEQENPWFKPAMARSAINAVRGWLTEHSLREWLAHYPILPVAVPLKVGVVMAGNVPLVGFHDWLSVWMSGHTLLAKYSSQDSVLIKTATSFLREIAPTIASSIQEVDLIKDADAFIATGSDNTSRYFEYYFASKPHIIRRNRVSVAVLTGNETSEELVNLGEDVFKYYGQGCRNIAYIWMPKGYNPGTLLKCWDSYASLTDFSKYFHNYEYQKALLLMHGTDHLDSGFVLFKASDIPASPLALLHYGYYSEREEVLNWLQKHKAKLQCVVSGAEFLPDALPFGSTQCPSLLDYADGIDVMAFLSTLRKV